MGEIQQSVLKALFNSHPDAYFLIGTIMHRAGRDWEDILEKAEIVNANRLARALRRAISAADRKLQGDPQYWRFSPHHRFQFRAYRKVKAQVRPALLTCKSCGIATTLADLEAKQVAALMCPRCHVPYKQVIHVFTHSSCGSIEEIKPRRCPACKKAFLRLHIDNADFGRSRWVCPQGCHLHDDSLYMICSRCSHLGQDARRMRPLPAASATKAASMTLVDINSDMDWVEIAKVRFGIKQETIRELILKEYEHDPIAWRLIERALNENEDSRSQLYEEFLSKHPELRGHRDAIIEAAGQEPCDQIKRLLAEYHGTTQAAIHSGQDLMNSHLRSLIGKEFHLGVRYINNLPLQKMIYGYQVGSNDPTRSKVVTFDEGVTSYVLTQRIETEALLFDLDAQAVRQWINARRGLSLGELELHRRLIGAGEDDLLNDQAYADVEALLHTLSHLLIRQAELFTGQSRESLSEVVYAPAMAFGLFSQEGSELGALRTAYGSYNVRQWLREAWRAARECPNDPACYRCAIAPTAACHACLFIAERNCNGFWNERLDRRLVSDLATGQGFWDE